MFQKHQNFHQLCYREKEKKGLDFPRFSVLFLVSALNNRSFRPPTLTALQVVGKKKNKVLVSVYLFSRRGFIFLEPYVGIFSNFVIFSPFLTILFANPNKFAIF